MVFVSDVYIGFSAPFGFGNFSASIGSAGVLSFIFFGAEFLVSSEGDVFILPAVDGLSGAAFFDATALDGFFALSPLSAVSELQPIVTAPPKNQ